jgi:hypothetical protein
MWLRVVYGLRLLVDVQDLVLLNSGHDGYKKSD